MIAISPTVLGSVDPPGVNQDLFFPFNLLTRTRAATRGAFENESFQTLPRILIPNPYNTLKPPVMHYGWEANFDSLLSLAEELNCIVSEDDDMKRSSSDSEDSFDAELKKTYEEERAKEEADFAATGINPRWIGVRIFSSMWDVVELVAEQLGLHFPCGMLRIVGAFKNGQDTIISLYTNYDLRAKIPPEEDIRRLADRLGISEEPKWYLDDMQFTWNTYGRQW